MNLVCVCVGEGLPYVFILLSKATITTYFSVCTFRCKDKLINDSNSSGPKWQEHSFNKIECGATHSSGLDKSQYGGRSIFKLRYHNIKGCHEEDRSHHHSHHECIYMYVCERHLNFERNEICISFTLLKSKTEATLLLLFFPLLFRLLSL